MIAIERAQHVTGEEEKPQCASSLEFTACCVTFFILECEGYLASVCSESFEFIMSGISVIHTFHL